MAYESFAPTREILFSEIDRYDNTSHGLLSNLGLESSILKFYLMKGVVVKDYKAFGGPLIQIEASLNGEKYMIPDDSRILTLRAIGNDKELKLLKKFSGLFRKIKTLEHEDIGTLTGVELEKLAKNPGFVIKNEFGECNIII